MVDDLSRKASLLEDAAAGDVRAERVELVESLRNRGAPGTAAKAAADFARVLCAGEAEGE